MKTRRDQSHGEIKAIDPKNLLFTLPQGRGHGGSTRFGRGWGGKKGHGESLAQSLDCVFRGKGTSGQGKQLRPGWIE